MANAMISRYGEPGGDPTEYLTFPSNLPHLFGELGSAVAVSQTLASLQDRLVLCIIGDGECETPATIAAFVHRNELNKLGEQRLLIAVNCNGHRMGGKTSMSHSRLRNLLSGLGYRVFTSDTQADEAAEAAAQALRSASENQPTIWLSVTEKGWPAPESLAETSFTGHAAHKITSIIQSQAAVEAFDAFSMSTQRQANISGLPDPERVELASKISFAVQEIASAPAVNPLVRDSVSNALRSPMAAIDRELDRAGVMVFSPDEANSNHLKSVVRNNAIVEVLAEEVLFCWTIGAIAAGRSSAFVTYEAFAPLVGSQLAQYSKLVNAQHFSNRPPLVLICTSLAWANCPTHQNTDIWDIALNRSPTACTVCCPIGATSAAQRLSSALQRRDGSATVFFITKYPLPDLYDPGGSVFIYRHPDASSARHLIIACGDVCFIEAVAAAQLAAERGVVIDILAIAEPSILPVRSLKSTVSGYNTLLGSVMCAPRTLASTLFTACDTLFDVLGVSEAHAATPYDSLKASGVDRYSLLRKIAGISVPSAGEVIGPSLVPDFILQEDWRVISLVTEGKPT